MLDEFSRSRLLFGDAALTRFSTAHVAVFGIGGVGGHAAEALARSGIGHISLFDPDTVALTNINRQTVALHSTLNRPKVDVMQQRILDINPAAQVDAHALFFTPETPLDFTGFTYIIDAIDTVTAKVELVRRAAAAGVPIISAMGAGNKLDPTAFQVADLSKTQVCPLARIMRKKLKDLGIYHLKVVYSQEEPLCPTNSNETKGTAGRPAPGSCAFVPAVVGLILAGAVIKDLAK